jgi:hypothetical protein
MVWAHSLCGGAVEILARWTYGEGSAAEAIGAAFSAACWPLMVRLFPVFFPLLLVRGLERAEFERKEEREENEVRRGKVLILIAQKVISLFCFQARTLLN